MNFSVNKKGSENESRLPLLILGEYFVFSLCGRGLQHTLIVLLFDGLIHPVDKLEAASEADAHGREDCEHESPHPDSIMADRDVLHRVCVYVFIDSDCLLHLKYGYLLVLKVLQRGERQLRLIAAVPNR